MAASWFMSVALLTAIGHLLSTNLAIASAQAAFRQPASPGYSSRDACPERCVVSGSSSSNWSVYHNFGQFQSCQETLFYEFNIHDNVDDAKSLHRIYSCASYGSDWDNLPGTAAKLPVKLLRNATYEIGWQADDVTGRSSVGAVVVLIKQLRQYLSNGHGSTNETTFSFAQIGQTAIGIYIGKGLQNEGISSFALQALEDKVYSSKLQTPYVAMQMCAPDRGRDHIFGVMATSNGTFNPIQNAIKAWARADCLSFNESSNFTGPAYFITPPSSAMNTTFSRNRETNSTEDFKSRISPFSARADCRTVQVQGGDSCAALAQRCGISGANFMEYNPGSNFCASLMPGQHACCSSGSLPDFTPKPGADGSCHVYTVHTGDSCSSIAAANSITIKDLERYNKKTWGWNGCQNIWDEIRICLSSGTPPMPAPVTNAVCGPQVPGTQPAAAGADISQLNPCPLNACCDVWGQCGTTTEFCVDTSTGAPGTAEPGTNGCISNCGTTIVRGDAPAVFRKIGYFEGYSFSSRQCLYQDALQIDGSQYTHVHFAFGMITHDYQVHTGNAETTYEFENFKRLQGAKRILSFGGWDFSTSPETYTIFREGVKDANRLTLATNIADFIKKHDLDGVDIDWEYPSAPDIPDIPPGSKEEGMDYFKFLVVLKNLLGGKSVSIAAPASYWYLKGFPIRAMSLIVDYIVFMTYDLHGQWDSQNQWSQVGCPSGMCLRSGVNLTETINSLVMITKAGVPSGKIVVGVTSYGRSFGMAQAGCYGPDCFYTGGPRDSHAAKGRCTDTAGYIADAEIKEIVKDSSRVNQNFLDGPSNSNILVYDDIQWVSYMSPEVRSTRTVIYKTLNMGGTTNWAIDLEDYHNVPQDSASPSWAIFRENIKAGRDPDQKGERHGNWTSLTCTDRAVVDNDNLTPSERWSRLDAADAWKDVIDIWKTYYRGKSTKTFTEAVSNILHGPQGVDCGTLQSSSHCDNTKECTDFVGSGTGPAGYEIFNSFVTIHGQALTAEAATYIDNALVDFENKFAPVPPPPDNQWLFLLIDLITLGVSMAAGPFFNSCLSYFAKNGAAAGNLKDTTMTLIGQSTTIAKDMLSTGSNDAWTPGKQAEFSHYMGQALSAWADLSERTVKKIFDGSDESIELLTSLLSDGKLIVGKDSKLPGAGGNAALKTLIGKAFFAYAIPAIWSVSGMSPFIIDSGFACGTIDPIGGYMKPDAMHKSWACVDDKLYYLATPKGGAKYCFTPIGGGPQQCKDNTFSALPGIEWLDGSSFGQVTLSNLITGSVRTYKSNGNQNTNTSPDLGKLADAESLGRQDITAPGYIRMPVCSPAVARKAWIGSDDGPDTTAAGYPCVVPKNDDYCGDSTFVDQTSGASPPVSDCLKLVEKIQARPQPTDHEIENAIGSQHQIEEYGECKFGVQGNGKHGNIDFHVGGQDIIDIINDSIKRFGSSGRVGAKGNMDCKGTTFKRQNVNWGLY
ncbi:chitinase (glycoside hydrolase family 18) [Metarhizium robertsii]|uniref:chitinase n=1 Tax=Metarhizium robertsii TaxID=568076 RepID=A0A014R0W8_9HYPO|nr:chitinase (glycoside hydrolase family 18) [Metarhizium robertsii]